MKRSRLVDRYGNPMRATTSGWEPSGGGERAKAWRAAVSPLFINSLLSTEQTDLVRAARDAERRNPYASRARDVVVANLVGDGIVPLPRVKNETLRESMKEVWKEWVENADADGGHDFYGLQALMVSGMFSAGDAFVRFRARRPEDGLTVPLQLQVLDGRFCDNSKTEVGLRPGRSIRNGVEFNAIGRRTAYWMFRSHPDESAWLTSSVLEAVPVPADQIAHLYHALTPGQIRGVPWSAAVLSRLKELDEYEDAELVRKKTMAMFAAFVTNPDADSLFNDEEETVDTDAVDGVPYMGLEPATMQELEPGQDIRFSNPTDSGSQLEPFIKLQQRAVATGYGLTYYQLTGDLADVNFTSSRAALIEQRRRFSQVQRNTITFKVNRPVYRRVMEAAQLAGAITLPKSEPEANLFNPRWITTPGHQYMDPLKEMNAAKIAMEIGLETRSSLIVERKGMDPDDFNEELEKDKAEDERLGINQPPALPDSFDKKDEEDEKVA